MSFRNTFAYLLLVGLIFAWTDRAHSEEVLLGSMQEAPVDDQAVPTPPEGITFKLNQTDSDTKITLSFETLRDQVQAHIDLDTHGIKTRFTLIQPNGPSGLPIYLDLEGPAFKDSLGVRITIHF